MDDFGLWFLRLISVLSCRMWCRHDLRTRCRTSSISISILSSALTGSTLADEVAENGGGYLRASGCAKVEVLETKLQFQVDLSGGYKTWLWLQRQSRFVSTVSVAAATMTLSPIRVCMTCSRECHRSCSRNAMFCSYPWGGLKPLDSFSEMTWGLECAFL